MGSNCSVTFSSCNKKQKITNAIVDIKKKSLEASIYEK